WCYHWTDAAAGRSPGTGCRRAPRARHGRRRPPPADSGPRSGARTTRSRPWGFSEGTISWPSSRGLDGPGPAPGPVAQTQVTGQPAKSWVWIPSPTPTVPTGWAATASGAVTAVGGTEAVLTAPLPETGTAAARARSCPLPVAAALSAGRLA